MVAVTTSHGSDGPCRTIRSIQIKTLDVFEGDRDLRFYHRWMQGLHRSTRVRVIRRELLIREGDCLDQELVAESERNLRAMAILSDASITVVDDHEGDGVDLLVVTKDRFTFRTELSFSRKGGLNKVRYSLGDTNMLGLGMDLHYSDSSRSDGSEIKRLRFRNPRFLKHFQLAGTYSQTDEGDYTQASFAKPFWSLNDPFAWELRSVSDQTSSDYYVDGGMSIEIPHDITRHTWSWSREGGDAERSRRWSVGGGYNRWIYESVAEIAVPNATESTYLDASLTFDHRRRFLVMTGVDSMRRTEDISEHRSLFIGLRRDWRRRDGTREDHRTLQMRLHTVWSPHPSWLLAGGLSADARFFEFDSRALELETFGHAYVFLPHDQTLVGGVTYRYSNTQDDLYLPLVLGEDVGLRGYQAFSLTGNKLLLINLEHRLTYPWKTRNSSWGQVVFLDSGSTWKPGVDPNLSDLHWGVGFGIRADMPSVFGKRVLRLDLAHGFDGEELSVSASVGQIFQHDSINRGFGRDY